jgi:hypothetical protein
MLYIATVPVKQAITVLQTQALPTISKSGQREHTLICRLFIQVASILPFEQLIYFLRAKLMHHFNQ